MKEYSLVADATLVNLCQNKVVRITKIPLRWLEEMKNEAESLLQIYAANNETEASKILEIHLHSRNPGLK